MPARAAEDETRIETVAGYEISRVNDPKDLYPCRMVRAYRDAADNNAANALAFGELDGLLLVSLVYERWKWPAGKTVKSRFSIDRTLIDAQAPWLGNATYLAIRVPLSHLPTFNAGKKIVLGFKDGTADFDLTGFKPAFEATRRCNRDAATARTAAATPARPAAEKPAASGSPIAIPAPAPSPPPAPVAAKASPAAPVPAAPAGPLPSEDRAIAYLFALYDRWAFGVCEIRTTASQRTALEAKAAALEPEMTAIEAELQKQLPSDPARCPPADVIGAQVKLLLDNGPEDFVAKMDKRPTEEFRGIVRPILERLKPAAPAPAPAAATGALPSEPRIAGYLLGLTFQDILQRCDFATTAKQRAGLDAKVEALRPEMAEVDSTVRLAIEKQGCPGPNDLASAGREVATAIDRYIATTPEQFAAFLDAKRDGAIMRDVKKIVAQVRPSAPEPSPAQFAAFLWGLLMQDKIAQCDIATTAKQRAGLDARVASLKQELGAYEGALRDQIKGRTEGCPSPEKAAEFLSLLPVFIDAQPEVFAAEMDKATAARNAKAAAATPAPAKEPPPAQPPSAAAAKPASCGLTTFPLTRVDLVAALKERLRPLGVDDVVEKPRSVANHRRYDLKGADVTIDMDGPDGRLTAFYVNQIGESSKRETEVALASASYIVATFTRGSQSKVADDMKARLGATPLSPGRSEKFDTSTVFYTKPDGGYATMLIDNADAGDCKP